MLLRNAAPPCARPPARSCKAEAMQSARIIWHNGEFKSWQEFAADSFACFAFADSCVTETVSGRLNAEGSMVLFRAKDHAKRFIRSAKTCLMELPYEPKKLADAAKKLLQKSLDEKEDAAECLLEMRAFDAPDQVHVIMQCWPLADFSQDSASLSVSVGVSAWRRSLEFDVLHQAFAAPARMEQKLMRSEVRQRGLDEPIVLNVQGRVTDAAGPAVFAVRCGVLSTPPLADGPAESIARDSVLHLALDLEIPMVEESVTRTDLYMADELFLVSDEEGILPVHSVDGRVIAAVNEYGPVTRLIAERLEAAQRGEHPNYISWIS